MGLAVRWSIIWISLAGRWLLLWPAQFRATFNRNECTDEWWLIQVLKVGSVVNWRGYGHSSQVSSTPRWWLISALTLVVSGQMQNFIQTYRPIMNTTAKYLCRYHDISCNIKNFNNKKYLKVIQALWSSQLTVWTCQVSHFLSLSRVPSLSSVARMPIAWHWCEHSIIPNFKFMV